MTLVSISEYGHGLGKTPQTCGRTRTAAQNRRRILARPQRLPPSAPRICSALRPRHWGGHRFAAEGLRESI